MLVLLSSLNFTLSAQLLIIIHITLHTIIALAAAAGGHKMLLACFSVVNLTLFRFARRVAFLRRWTGQGGQLEGETGRERECLSLSHYHSHLVRNWFF